MSTRVQKGSQKFRPVAKPRPGVRTGDVSRQTSTIPESVVGNESVTRSTPLSQPAFRAPSASVQGVGPQPTEEEQETVGVDTTEQSQNCTLSELNSASQNDNNDTQVDSQPVTWATPWTQPNSFLEPVHSQSRATPIIIGTSRGSRIVVPTNIRRNEPEPLSVQASRPPPLQGVVDDMLPVPTQQPVLPEEPEVTPSVNDTLNFTDIDLSTRAAVEAIANTIFSAQNQNQGLIHVADANAPDSTRSAQDATPETNQPTDGQSKAKRSSRKGKDKAGEDSERKRGARAPRRSRKSSGQQTPSSQADDADGGEEGSEQTPRAEKRKRRSGSPSSSRKSRGKSLSSFDLPMDPSAEPGEELDPTATTMAAICIDTGRGRLSSKAQSVRENHLAWKATNKAKRARLRAIMENKKFGKTQEEAEATVDGDNEGNNSVPTAAPTDPATQASSSTETVLNAPSTSNVGFDYGETMATNRFNVQIRIGPNGETIIDEESLFVDRSENPEYSTEQYTHVEESDQTRFTNSMSYSKKARGSRWNAEETELFYDALQQFGENYELISYMLPGRDRKACISKFKAEDRRNPARINFCLNNRTPLNMEALSRMTGKDFSGPTPDIQIPEIPRLDDEEQTAPHENTETTTKTKSKVRKKSRTPTANDVEVLGDVETFDLDAVDSS